MKQNKSVPFFNYPNVYLNQRKEFLDIFNDVCERGAFIMQKDLLDFEKIWRILLAQSMRLA